MEWQNQIFIDKGLPVGLRSAPKIHCSISDALEWILLQKGISSCLHYINDFLTFGELQSEQCKKNLDLLIVTCKILGIPLAMSKVEGPGLIIVFLGIEFDTINMIMRLPDDKLARIKTMIKEWMSKKAARKQELLSVIGNLAHACKSRPSGSNISKKNDHISLFQATSEGLD